MKRVLTMCFAVLMVLFCTPSTVKAAGGVTTITVTADKTTLHPGDTVNFDVKLGAVTNLGGLDFKLSIPAGLTIMEDSLTMQAGLKDILKSDGDIIPPSGQNDYMWCYSVGAEGYTASTEVCILSFSCTVDANAVLEGKTVSLTVGQCFENAMGTNYDDIAATVVPAAVTVEKATVAVSGVTLSQAALSMKAGETSVLTAVVEPANADNRSVSWSSSDPSVVSVGTDGTVTAVKPGSGVITVTTADGGKTAACTVTVSCDHVLNKIAAVEADCENAGNIEHFACGLCGKTFADAAGQTEITNVTAPAKGHTGEEWLKDETDHWKVCSTCGKEFGKAAHTYSWVVDVAATEDMEGIQHEECVCGVKRSENTVLPKLHHVHTGIEHHGAVAATCSSMGNVEYWTCSSAECAGKYYSDDSCQNEIASIITLVDPENHVYENASDPDCNLCGYRRSIADQGNAGGTGDSQDNSGNVGNSNSGDSGNSTGQVSPKTGETDLSAYLIWGMAVCAAVAAGLTLYKKKFCK